MIESFSYILPQRIENQRNFYTGTNFVYLKIKIKIKLKFTNFF